MRSMEAEKGCVRMFPGRDWPLLRMCSSYRRTSSSAVFAHCATFGHSGRTMTPPHSLQTLYCVRS